MIRVDIRADVASAAAALTDLARQQLPFIKRLTVTALARQAVLDLKDEMNRVFDRPTRYTLNAFFAKPATSRDDSKAYVATREFSGKNGRPAWKYLKIQAVGGPRLSKGVELKLSALSRGQYVVPTRATPLDGNGNIQRGWMTQVLSRVGAAGDASVGERTTKRLQKQRLTVAAAAHRSDYFVGHEGGSPAGRPTGIYRLTGPGRVQMVLAFRLAPPTYEARFAPEKTVAASVRRNFQIEFDRAVVKALATTR